MNRTLIEKIPEELPHELSKLVSGARVYDSSCSPEARVYFIDKNDGYYLKISPAGTLENEAIMDRYFHKLGLGAEVLFFSTEKECDFLLTARVEGEDSTHENHLNDPERLCDLMATELRRLHETEATECPIERMEGYFKTVDEGYSIGRCDLSYYTDLFGDITKEEAYALALSGRESLNSRVLLHGDFCLPNIMLEDFKLSGYIDLGNGGIGDRHIDIYWGIWTLIFNLHTDKYTNRFIDAYGRELVDIEKLKTVAAAECFG